MIIRNAHKSGKQLENVFEAVDSLDNSFGWCRVDPLMNGDLMPERPLEIKISAGGEDEAQLQLLAAAMARAMVIAREHQNVKARVFAEVSPDDDALMERLASLGFIDDDAIVRMRRRVVSGPATARLPEGCVLIADRLDDAAERRFFLERAEQLFRVENAEAWLQSISAKPGFRRLLLTARNGLAGELICWAEPESRTGVIGQVYTAPDWRRKGVASHLMGAARQYFDAYRVSDEYLPKLRFAKDRPLDDRLTESMLDVRLRMTAAARLAAASGYRRDETLIRLPGIDL